MAVALALVVWLSFNPPGRFGWCFYAWTSYNAFPRPVFDLQVRSDGALRTVEKTHELSLERIRWLLDPAPEVLIVSIGWDGVVRPGPEIAAWKGCEVRILKNRDAIQHFNDLKRAGRKVAIHYHSTC